MKYKCIKDFLVDEYDDNGAFADKQILCEKDSIWEIDEIANRFIGDKETVRLIGISNKDSFRWMEISKEMLDECFKCEVDSSKLKGKIRLGQHTTNKDDYWIYDDNGLICGTAGINEDKVKAMINLANREIPMGVIKIEGVSSQACPVCKSNVNNKYCSNCGQRISY